MKSNDAMSRLTWGHSIMSKHVHCDLLVLRGMAILSAAILSDLVHNWRFAKHIFLDDDRDGVSPFALATAADHGRIYQVRAVLEVM